jgi:hypothetical protein
LIYARQSTAIIVTVGPVLDADGVAVTDGVVGDFVISKNGGAPAALNASATLTHRNTGHYSLSLTATDVNTVGTAEVIINDTVNACPMKEIQVVEPATYDVLFADAAPGPASPTNITAGTVTTATNVTTVNGLAANVITATSIQADAITAAKIADGAIDANTFAAGAITASAIAADAIGASELAADAVAEIADAVWDEDATAHQSAGTFGLAIGDPAASTETLYKAIVTDPAGTNIAADIIAVKADTAAILADTGTDGVVVASGSKTGYSLTATTGLGNQTADITGSLSGSVGSVTGAVGSVTGAVGSVTGAVGSVTGAVGSVTGLTASDVGAIKTQTDKFVFTVANQVDANIQYVNDVAVTGTGAAGNEWGP